MQLGKTSGERALLAAFALAACVWAAIGFAAFKAYEGLKPPNTCQTICDFAAFLPEPHAIVNIENGGRQFIVIFGRQPLILFSEAPAGYLFDANGKLMEWSVESTDTDRHSHLWRLARDEIYAKRVLNYDDLSMCRF
jgi:hypothetical protein